VRDAKASYMDERLPADKILIRKKDVEADQAWLDKFTDEEYDIRPVPKDGKFWEPQPEPRADPAAAREKLTRLRAALERSAPRGAPPPPDK